MKCTGSCSTLYVCGVSVPLLINGKMPREALLLSLYTCTTAFAEHFMGFFINVKFH